MIGNDVMSAPLRRAEPSRADQITKLNVALTNELNWFTEMWNKEHRECLMAQRQVEVLQELVQELELVLEGYEAVNDDLLKQVVELTKTHKRSKRKPSTYMKRKSSPKLKDANG